MEHTTTGDDTLGIKRQLVITSITPFQNILTNIIYRQASTPIDTTIIKHQSGTMPQIIRQRQSMSILGIRQGQQALCFQLFLSRYSTLRRLLGILPVNTLLLKGLTGSKDNFVILMNLITLGVFLGFNNKPVKVILTFIVRLFDLRNKFLGFLTKRKLTLYLGFANHHITIPTTATHITTVTPTACISKLTHLGDADKRIGITGEYHLMPLPFLRELIRLLFHLGHILRGLIKTLTNLSIKGFHLLFQPLQLIFLTPRLSGDTLILGDIGTEFFVTLLVLCNDTGNFLQCIDTIAHGTKTVILAHGKFTVIMFIEVITLHVELVTGIHLFSQFLIIHIDGVNHQRETIDGTHLAVFITYGTTGILKGSTHFFDIISAISSKLTDIIHHKTGQGSTILALLHL